MEDVIKTGDQALQLLHRGRLRLRTSPLRAADDFKAALALEPESTNAYVLLSSAYLLTQDRFYWAHALDAANAALALAPEDVSALCSRGECLRVLRRLGQARETLEQAIALDPYHVQAHRCLARVYYQNLQWAKAESLARKAIELGPEEPKSYELLGRILTRLQRPDEARFSLEEAIRLDPENSDAFFHLSSVHEEGGRDQETLDVLAESLRLNPENENAQVRMIFLQSDSIPGRVFQRFQAWKKRHSRAFRMLRLFFIYTFVMGLGCGQLQIWFPDSAVLHGISTLLGAALMTALLIVILATPLIICVVAIGFVSSLVNTRKAYRVRRRRTGLKH